MSPDQCRAGRALSKLSENDLAVRARVDLKTLQDFEAGHGASPDSISALRLGLEAAGIVLIDAGSASPTGGEGARLGKMAQRSVDTIEKEVVQYPEFLNNDAPPGAGG